MPNSLKLRPRGALLLLGLLGAIALAIQGCAETSEFRPVPVIPGGGGSTAPSAPAQRVQPAAPPATQKMLQDPENVEDWQRDVYVDFDQDGETMRRKAQSKCTRLVKGEPLSTFLNVQQRTFTPNRNNQTRWTCNFQSERSGGAAYDDRNKRN